MTHAFPDETDAPRLTRAVQWLLALNAGVYFLQMTVVSPAIMQQALGSSWGSWSEAWWTTGTYMFVHGSFWHLALNMYTLFLFGPRLEHAWGTREFTRFYLLCGIGGWAAQMLLVRQGLLIGASAAVLGVLLAYALRWPDDEVYVLGVLPMRVKWIVALLVGVNLTGGLLAGESGGGVAYLAHLGGMATGWVLLRTSAGVSIDRMRQRVSPLPDTPEETPRAVPRSMPRSRERGRDIDDIVAQSNAALRRNAAPSPPMSARPEPAAADLNTVLDKISRQGIDSLTGEERRLLEDKSRELRGGA
jgi:membrane associated rhomboid family serine protease